nr:hypothetical protein [Desulfobulbus sp.]
MSTQPAICTCRTANAGYLLIRPSALIDSSNLFLETFIPTHINNIFSGVILKIVGCILAMLKINRPPNANILLGEHWLTHD